MTDDEGLFPLPADVVAPAAADVDLASLSADRRRTLRQRADVDRGVHPLTGEPTRPDLGTCGDCALRRVGQHHDKRYAKCWRDGGVLASHSAASDVRAWWPACPSWVSTITARPVDTC